MMWSKTARRYCVLQRDCQVSYNRKDFIDVKWIISPSGYSTIVRFQINHCVQFS